MIRYTPLEQNGYKFFGKRQESRPARSPSREVATKSRRRLPEEVASHKDSIVNLSDQIGKFLTKHKENPNAAVNSISIGIFLGFSEWFAKDGDPKTDGVAMLQKVMDKMKALAKQYDDLIPEPEEDFTLDTAIDEVMGDEEDPVEEEPEEDEGAEPEEDPNSDIPVDEEEEDPEADEENEKEEQQERSQKGRISVPMKESAEFNYQMSESERQQAYKSKEDPRYPW